MSTKHSKAAEKFQENKAVGKAAQVFETEIGKATRHRP